MTHARSLLLAAAGAALFLGAGCAMSDGPARADAAPRQCFFVSQVNGFASDNERVVNLRVGVNDIYRAELFGPCSNVDWSQRIAIRARGGGSSVCSGHDAELIVPATSGRPQTCQLRSIRKLSDAEIAALPGRERP
ncbi:MAG TPA: DUF6491 family protein [Caulobacteraceae bacterium]